jgi:hypothetical protein
MGDIVLYAAIAAVFLVVGFAEYRTASRDD